MLVVGLTGGIGSGKSTFASLLAERGAQVLDADLFARDALKPSEPGWRSVVDQFGDEVLVPTTLEIDRARLADIVFDNPAKLAALNAIVHPAVFGRIADALERLANTDEVVILDAALIVETGLDRSVDVLIVVTADEQARLDRLTNSRGMSVLQIRSRMAAQTDPDALVSKADIVVHNDGGLDDLALEADRVWQELRARSPS